MSVVVREGGGVRLKNTTKYDFLSTKIPSISDIASSSCWFYVLFHVCPDNFGFAACRKDYKELSPELIYHCGFWATQFRAMAPMPDDRLVHWAFPEVLIAGKIADKARFRLSFRGERL